MENSAKPGIVAALGAALLFGASTPCAKFLLGQMNPWLLAGALYIGSGIGLTALQLARSRKLLLPHRSDWPWLASAIACGGIVAPVLLMWGLASMPSSGAALLLNAESAFTVLLAWLAFREHIGPRILVGMLLILAGALILSWRGTVELGSSFPTLAVVGACLCWAIDNNLTRKVSLSDANSIALIKGLCAGSANLALATHLGADWPRASVLTAAALLGFLCYGVSLSLFILALRALGSARTGAYFSVAPFVGAALGVVMLGEPLTAQLSLSGALMLIGVWLHATENHSHLHAHDPIEHAHEHEHDVHHTHHHDPALPPGVRHTHSHRHQTLQHSHPHFPDAHHRHSH